MTQQKIPCELPMKVLVVDDRVDVANTLALLIKKLGGTVQVAYGAHEALKKGAIQRPDVIFLDIGLPDLSGYDVCKEMRHTDWGASPLIVALTGRNEPEDMIRSAHTGFDRHVAKPMEMETLNDILRTVKTRMAFNSSNGAPDKDAQAFR